MFRYKFMTLSQLGKVFGVTNQTVGKWLVELGLRTTDHKPSEEALHGGFVERSYANADIYSWSWHSEKTVTALEAAGHLRVLSPPAGLIDPPRLQGPFSLRPVGDGSFQILSADGCIPISVIGERNASFILKILDIAHRGGVIEKHLGVANK